MASSKDEAYDLRGVESALTKANKEVMNALEQASKNVTEALEKANQNVENALAKAVKETQDRAIKQAEEARQVLKHPTAFESIPKGTEEKMVPLVVSVTRQPTSASPKGWDGLFDDKKFAFPRVRSCDRCKDICSPTYFKTNEAICRDMCATAFNSKSAAVNVAAVAAAAAGAAAAAAGAAAAAAAAAVAAMPLEPTTTASPHEELSDGERGVAVEQRAIVDDAEPSIAKAPSEALEIKSVGSLSVEEIATEPTIDAVLPADSFTSAGSEIPAAASEVTIKSSSKGSHHEESAKESPTPSVKASKTSTSTKGSQTASIKKSSSASTKASTVASEAKSAEENKSQASSSKTSRKSNEVEEADVADEAGVADVGDEAVVGDVADVTDVADEADVADVTGVTDVADVASFKSSSSKNSRPESIKESPTESIASSEAKSAEENESQASSSKISRKSSKASSRKSTTISAQEEEEVQGAVESPTPSVKASRTSSTRKESPTASIKESPSASTKASVAESEVKSVKEHESQASSSKISRKSSKAEEGAKAASPKSSKASSRKSSTMSAPKEAAGSRKSSTFSSRIPVPVQKISKSVVIECDCGKCDCQFCSPEITRQRDEERKKAKIAEGRPDECTCMSGCTCKLCTETADLVKTVPKDQIKESSEEVSVKQVKSPKELSVGLLNEMECCHPTPEHPPDCDCIDCLCDPCAAHPKDFITTGPVPVCDCLTCMCDPCEHGSKPCSETSKTGLRESSRPTTPQRSRQPSTTIYEEETYEEKSSKASRDLPGEIRPESSGEPSQELSHEPSQKLPRQEMGELSHDGLRESSSELLCENCEPSHKASSESVLSQEAMKKSSPNVFREPSREPSRKLSHEASREICHKSSRGQSREDHSKLSSEPSCECSREPSREPSREIIRESSRKLTPEGSRTPSREPSREPSRKPSREPSREALRQKSKEPSGETSRSSLRKLSHEVLRQLSQEALRQLSREVLRQSSRESGRKSSKEATIPRKQSDVEEICEKWPCDEMDELPGKPPSELSLRESKKASREASARKILGDLQQRIVDHPPGCDCLVCRCCACFDKSPKKPKVVKPKPKPSERKHLPAECMCKECLCVIRPSSPRLEPLLEEKSFDVLIEQEGEQEEIFNMDDQALESCIVEMEGESVQRKQEMDELQDVIKQIQCSCYEAEVRASATSQQATFIAKQSSFHDSVSGLQQALLEIQEKCKQKDRMIAAMVEELKLRANSKVFDEMLQRLEATTDFDRTEINGSLLRLISAQKNGKSSKQLKELLTCKACHHQDFPNCPCENFNRSPAANKRNQKAQRHPNLPNRSCETTPADYTNDSDCECGEEAETARPPPKKSPQRSQDAKRPPKQSPTQSSTKPCRPCLKHNRSNTRSSRNNEPELQTTTDEDSTSDQVSSSKSDHRCFCPSNQPPYNPSDRTGPSRSNCKSSSRSDHGSPPKSSHTKSSRSDNKQNKSKHRHSSDSQQERPHKSDRKGPRGSVELERKDSAKSNEDSSSATDQCHQKCLEQRSQGKSLPSISQAPTKVTSPRPASAEGRRTKTVPVEASTSRPARLRKSSPTPHRSAANMCECDRNTEMCGVHKPQAPLGEVISSSPMEIVEIRRISPDSLIVKWNSPDSKFVTGYEILVNGIIKSRVHSLTRTSAILHMVSLNTSLNISIFAITSAGRCQPPVNAVFQV